MAEQEPGRKAEWVAVTLEPREGRTDREVVRALRSAGAREIDVLAPRFISAQALSDSLGDLKEVAEVHVKMPKQMH
ncbi:MAG: hypothetical protein U0835_13355 [Isosphaeraceae bacterium]